MKRQALMEKAIREQLMGEIREVRISLETAHSNFENASDPDLIDCYIYEMNAIHFRYKYLLRQVRECK
ncbi:MAG: YaaL family protein [Lachnoclostridium sp.]|jgi:hypothetical protein|nr:YaaL family protein [Lachnoclostridium sp.]